MGAKHIVVATERNIITDMGIEPFDVADYLDNETIIDEYLSAAAENPNPNVLLQAQGNVARISERDARRIARLLGGPAPDADA